jgi:hypothetical protein
MSIPGLPALSAASAAFFSEVAFIASDGPGVSTAATTSQWGIFLNGDPVVIADNVLSMEFRQDFKISNYPVEQGAFASYNKVQMPMEVKFRFSAGGSSSNRSNMLNSIGAVIGDTNLYDVVTPDATYVNFNFTHQDYRRTAQEGAGLLSVDVWVEEIRTASLVVSNTGTGTSTDATGAGTGATATTTPPAGDTGPFTSNNIVANDFDAINNPQSASASPQVNGGNVQGQTPTASQSSAFSANSMSGAGFDF